MKYFRISTILSKVEKEPMCIFRVFCPSAEGSSDIFQKDWSFYLI